MPAIRLDARVLDAEWWADAGVRDVYLAALLMAEPVVLTEDTPAFELGTGARSNWTIPAGKYGLIRGATHAILRRCPGADEHVLTRMGDPDPHSGDLTYDGRLLARTIQGVIVLQYQEFTADRTSAERAKRYRHRHGASRVIQRDATVAQRDVTVASRDGLPPTPPLYSPTDLNPPIAPPNVTDRDVTVTQTPDDGPEAVIALLNRLTGQSYRPTGVVLAPIVERMAEGATIGQLRAVTARKVREWSHDERMQVYLRPSTLYGKRFWTYASEVPEGEPPAEDGESGEEGDIGSLLRRMAQ